MADASTGSGDIAWRHGIPLTANKKQSQCNYCGKQIKGGGATRLKWHLAGGNRDVMSCPNVPSEVKKAMASLMKSDIDRRNKKKADKQEFEEACLEGNVGVDDDDISLDSDEVDQEMTEAEVRQLKRAKIASLRQRELDRQRQFERTRGAGSSREAAAEDEGRRPRLRSRGAPEIPFRRTQSVRTPATAQAPPPVRDPDVEILRADPDLFVRQDSKQKKIAPFLD